jgi:hypothetical protein
MQEERESKLKIKKGRELAASSFFCFYGNNSFEKPLG